MQGRASPAGDGKDSTQRTQSKALPFMLLLKFLILFLILGAGFSVLCLYLPQRLDARSMALQARASLRPSPDERSGLGRRAGPPPGLMHKMSDEELFRGAAAAPQMKKCSAVGRSPKVAFMFLTRGPLPLSPLWEKFFRGHEGLYSIYIHALPTYKAEFPPSSVFYRRLIPSQVSEWGQMSMCDAERRLLGNALLDPSNERFILLSESCIPLYNFSAVYQYLARSQHGFVGAFDDPGPHGRGRFNPRMAPEVNISQWRKGSQWFEVDRKLAVGIITDTKYYPKFKEFCRPSCYVDEHYFPTMLTVEAPHLIANRTITWTDWSRGGAHPATFGKADVTEVFLKGILEGKTCLYNNRTSSECFLFARKFAPSSLEPLLQLAPSVLGFG